MSMADEVKPTQSELCSSITKILRNGDLSQLTSKIVRTKLEELFDVSLHARKKEVDGLIMKMITMQQSSTEGDDDNDDNDDGDDCGMNDHSESDVKDYVPSHWQTKEGKLHQTVEDNRSGNDGSDDDDDVEDKNDNNEDDSVNNLVKDEELARKLQEDENHRPSRRSTTRQGKKSGKPQVKKSGKTKKESGKTPKRSGFTSLQVLSPALAEVVGAEKMSRAGVVKTMWKIIKERQLEDPKNKRMCICDEQLEKLFGRKRFLTFGMMKYLSNHMKDQELLQ